MATIAIAAKARTERAALATLLLGATCIAFSPILVRISELGPTATAVHRVALAVPALALWLILERRTAPAAPAAIWRSPWGLILAGLTFAADLGFWHWSISLTSVANATLLANLSPIFVTLGAFILFGERSRPAFFLGLAFSMIGAAVLMGGSLSLSLEHFWGDALGVVTALFYGAYLLVVSRLRNTYSTATIMVWSAVITAIVLLPIAMAVGDDLLPATLQGWAVLVCLAWISQVGGTSFIAHSLAHLPVAFSSVALLLQPVIAALLAWAVLAEPLGLQQALGGLVVLAGVVIARLASRAA